MSESDGFSVSYGSGNTVVRTLDNAAPSIMMRVYCTCGRIVTQDRAEMKLRLGLGKQLECSTCRNHRISHEIDALNEHFEPSEPDEFCYV